MGHIVVNSVLPLRRNLRSCEICGDGALRGFPWSRQCNCSPLHAESGAWGEPGEGVLIALSQRADRRLQHALCCGAAHCPVAAPDLAVDDRWPNRLFGPKFVASIGRLCAIAQRFRKVGEPSVSAGSFGAQFVLLSLTAPNPGRLRPIEREQLLITQAARDRETAESLGQKWGLGGSPV